MKTQGAEWPPPASISNKKLDHTYAGWLIVNTPKGPALKNDSKLCGAEHKVPMNHWYSALTALFRKKQIDRKIPP